MNQFINKKFIILLFCQILSQWVLALSTQNEIIECSTCQEDKDLCFNHTLPNEAKIIKPRDAFYIDMKKLYTGDVTPKNGEILEISYIVASPNGDFITVQIENANKNKKDQYIVETRDSRVDCSSRKNLRFYKQEGQRIAIYCNNLYYECEVTYEFLLVKPQEENNNNNKVPECSECSAENENSCIESVYLPVHSWYYLYYEGYEGGTYLDFLISSHKKDTMRIEVQNDDGTFYLVSTRRDKVKCSESQSGVPVRWKKSRVAVYCYNNYIGCRFSVYVNGQPMNRDTTKSKMMVDTKSLNPKWSEWSEWSECTEYREGKGIKTRERICMHTEIAFTDPENVTQEQHKEMDKMLESLKYPECEGPSMEEQQCQIEDSIQHSWQNLLIFVFIVSAIILSFYKIERKPTRPTINTHNYYENVVKSHDVSDGRSPERRISVSENSPLLNTYFRRYD